MKKVIRTKREFNAETRALIEEGYKKIGECGNTHRYRKRESCIALVQGWKGRN